MLVVDKLEGIVSFEVGAVACEGGAIESECDGAVPRRGECCVCWQEVNGEFVLAC